MWALGDPAHLCPGIEFDSGRLVCSLSAFCAHIAPVVREGIDSTWTAVRTWAHFVHKFRAVIRAGGHY